MLLVNTKTAERLNMNNRRQSSSKTNKPSVKKEVNKMNRKAVQDGSPLRKCTKCRYVAFTSNSRCNLNISSTPSGLRLSVLHLHTVLHSELLILDRFAVVSFRLSSILDLIRVIPFIC